MSRPYHPLKSRHHSIQVYNQGLEKKCRLHGNIRYSRKKFNRETLHSLLF